jgi:acyl-CoA thioesterase FadM
VVEWSSPAGLNDTLDLYARIERWGNTSLDVRVDGSVDDRAVFTATITYVGVKWATHTPTPPPPEVRAALDPSGE